MNDLLTSFAEEDLEESISLALLLRLHESGALSDGQLRDALRKVAGDLLAWLVADDSIDLDQLGEAFDQVVLGANERTGRRVLVN